MKAKTKLTTDEAIAAGLFVINGKVTHPAGDQYAMDVMTGRIPIETAIARERDAEWKFKQMSGGQ
jgi:hypothetical protein